MSHNGNDHHTNGPQEPPHKRTAIESASHADTSSSASNARARFLRELAQYASDDEDEVAAVARSRGQEAISQPTLLVPSFGSSSSTSPLPPLPALSPTADSDGFFFDQAGPQADNRNRDIAEDANDLRGEYNGHPASHPNVPSRVGLTLLHRMHAESTASTSKRALKAPPTTSSTLSQAAGVSGPSASFEVVHAYVPLSTGGFLSTAGAGEDLMEGRQVRVGDVLSLRKLRSATPQPPGGFPTSLRGLTSAASPPGSPKTSVPLPHASPTSSSSSPVAASQATINVADVAQKVQRHFKHAASYTDNEREYGMRLSPDMVRLLFEVTRVDAQGRSVEGLFLDGTRVKLPFRDIRPAGYDEQRRYGQWKADPSSRPVTTMHSGASSPTSASAPGTHPASPVRPASPGAGHNSDEATGSPSPSSSALPVAAAAWWVSPRLLVRIATEAAGDWYGKKCVVKAIRRSENAIRLMEWHDGAPQGEGSSGHTDNNAETRELIGVDGLETVVPKKGGRALIVLGPKKGEMCTVLSRVRGADGDLTGVEVEISRTKEVVTLRAEELCALAR